MCEKFLTFIDDLLLSKKWYKIPFAIFLIVLLSPVLLVVVALNVFNMFCFYK